jgi:hypothetical protein
MERANQKARFLSTNFTAYKATKLLRISVIVRDAVKAFLWLNTRTGTHVENVDLPSLVIRIIQNQKGNKKKESGIIQSINKFSYLFLDCFTD